MRGYQHSFVRSAQHCCLLGNDVLHPALSRASCLISNALEDSTWTTQFHTVTESGFQWTEKQGIAQPSDVRLRLQTACHSAAREAYNLRHATPMHRSHGQVTSVLRSVATQDCAVSQCTSWQPCSHWQSAPQQIHSSVLTGAVSGSMQGSRFRMFSGQVQEESHAVQEEEAEDESKLPSIDELFHEELIFDADGFAVSHGISPFVAKQPRDDQRHSATSTETTLVSASRREELLASLSGMLCILQLLPDDLSQWIASYLGFHTVGTMLRLRRDLEIADLATVIENSGEYCRVDSAASVQLAGTSQSDNRARAQLQELLLDDGLPSLLRLTDGSEVELPRILPAVYVLANLNRLNELLRSEPDMVAHDGVLISIDGSEDAAECSRKLCAGELLFEHSGDVTEALRGFRRLFSNLRRVGISRTLHRVACIEGVDGTITGLTLRIGRHIPAAAWPLTDVLAMIEREHRLSKYNCEVFDLQTGAVQVRSGLPCSVLVLGGPASGKTTILRDISQQLSVRFGLGRRVVIVDSSSEIGGQGQVPHPAVGTARRFVVPQGVQQSNVLIQALTNHNPDVIIVDELSGHSDIEAARSICHRGVNLIATAHATSLQYLLSNPQMNPVLGGLHEVILGAQEVRDMERRKGLSPGSSPGGSSSQVGRSAFSRTSGARTRTERRQPPCFQVIVEIIAPTAWRIHWNAAESIDALLAGQKPPSELRMMQNGRLYSRDESEEGTEHA